MHPPSTSPIDCKITLRLLKLLRKGSGQVLQVADGKTALVERADSQKLKLPLKTLQKALGAGLAVQARRSTPDEPFVVSLSPEGRAALGASNPVEKVDRANSRDRRNTPSNTHSLHHDGSPLARLFSPKRASGGWLSKKEYHAGERLRTDFEKSQLVAGLGVNWDSMGMPRFQRSSESSSETAEFADAARERLSKALTSVGPELSGLLLDVCCFLKGLERVEAERGWPRRSAKLLLKVALATLDRHYNPPPVQKHSARSVWHAGIAG